MNTKVDLFIGNAKKWKEEFMKLRGIILENGLAEELKWGVPCYTINNSNVVLIHGFKEYCAILFFKGALLKDEKKVLIRQTENVQSSRQIRFTSLNEIIGLESVLKSYIQEAVEVEKAGLKVKFKKTKEYKVPEEFQKKLVELPDLKKAFDELTPGRQRAYVLYFSSAKRTETRDERVKKYMKKILAGKGMDDW